MADAVAGRHQRVVRDADGETYEKHAEELVRFATLLVGPGGAEDLVAGAVLRAFSSPSWPSVTEPRAYLYRTVLNEARQLRRSTQRRLRREAAAARSERLHVPLVRPEVLDALRRLTVRQRAVIYLTYWLDEPPAEVARWLGTSRRTVERELTAARHRLEALLR
ncbi:MAG TPA: RNA polymerase sigma factor [Acidimicrobiales bacterium]|nr:RNA polymerase sigma factor [Acidimicrobiales bacterium]